MFLPAKEYLSEPLVSRLERELHAEFSSLVDRYGLTLKSAMDFFYVLSRNRYFIGMGEFPNSAIRPKVHALYSESLIAAAMLLRDDERAVGKLHYELMKKLSPELWKLPFSEQSWSESLVRNGRSAGNLVHAPITSKSDKLYGKVHIREVAIQSVPQEKISKLEGNEIDNKWRERQRALGRNWMWRNFDIIHSLSVKHVEGDCGLINVFFQKKFLDNLFSRPHSSFKRAADVRAVINILILYLFYIKSEEVSRVFKVSQ